MKFLLAVLAMVVMGLVLGAGLLLAAKGTYWFLVLGIIAFIAMFVRYGCWTH